MTNNRQLSLFEGERASMLEAIETSLASLNAYATEYEHWALAYSGGKDSSATVSFVVWAIESGLVPAPKSLTVLYADTRQELPVLSKTAERFLSDLRARGYDAQTALADIDNRFYVYMLGRGVPPPSNTFRWCTERIKIKPMADVLRQKHAEHRGKFILITGVRQGESAARDARIAISCNSKSGECGQGWYQQMSSDAINDTLAPLLHWRQCYVWDWLYFYNSARYIAAATEGKWARGHDFDYLEDIAVSYGDGDSRTGCIGCNLVSRDVALENTVKVYPEYAPLLEIRGVFAELKKPHMRLRKRTPERTQSGNFALNGQRMGALTIEARQWGFERISDIQQRAGVDLINAEESERIHWYWENNVYPVGWEGGLDNPNHVLGSDVIDSMTVVGDEVVITQNMFKIPSESE